MWILYNRQAAATMRVHQRFASDSLPDGDTVNGINKGALSVTQNSTMANSIRTNIRSAACNVN
jgi:hypothetical protein